jgi:hypothetical protein
MFLKTQQLKTVIRTWRIARDLERSFLARTEIAKTTDSTAVVLKEF